MNSSTRKNLTYILVFLVLGALAYAYWSKKANSVEGDNLGSQPGTFQFSGTALGTDYEVTYLDPRNRNFQSSLDSVFKKLDALGSITNSSSEISQMNTRDSLLSPSKDLLALIQLANRWKTQSQGALEASAITLEKSWTFSPSGAVLLDSMGVGEVMKDLGLEKIILTDSLIRKPFGVKVDPSKFWKGYALRQIETFLQGKEVMDYQIKLGNTEVAKGSNPHGELWKTEISYLGDSSSKLSEGQIAIQNLALSTAGNPEQFYVRDSTKVSFTLDPRTGFPVTHGLLAVTVFDPNPETADAWADILMVLGKNEAIKHDSVHQEMKMILIYQERNGRLQQYISPELKKFLSFSTEF